MDINARSDIYSRLLEIRVTLNDDPNPTPTYISHKIWECHRYIEETERYSIEIARDTSVIQQALNNTMAELQMKREKLISDPDIKQLPSIKDREAVANQRLKEEIDRQTQYQNELNDHSTLLKAVNQKMKNLTRLNGDIRMLVRILESQLKLDGMPKSDPVNQGLIAEMRKGINGGDAFEGAETSEEHVITADPTAPLDVQNLVDSKYLQEPGTVDLLNDLVPPEISSNTPPIQEVPSNTPLISEDTCEDDDDEQTENEDDSPYTIENSEEGPVGGTVNLDQILLPGDTSTNTAKTVEFEKGSTTNTPSIPQKPAEPAKEEVPQPEIDLDQKSQQQKPAGNNFDDLLDSLFK